MIGFDYAEFTTRNLGFVTADEQARLRAARVFIPGVGGMGGAAFMALVRAGIGRFAIADIDVYEVSNLNRQVFATLDTVGQEKVEAAAAAARRINPEVEIEVMRAEWVDEIESLLDVYKIVVNGTDDARAACGLYRAARIARATVVDAYAATLPSVFVVKPDDPRPEERMGYPTLAIDWRAITPEIAQACLMKELEWALVHSSTAAHVDLSIAAELAAGKRKRFSFAPMVVATGQLMAYETIRLVLGKPGGADHRGYFFNPHKPAVEKPLPWPISSAKAALVRRFMARMTTA
jgi:molybdopterin/thiamine biosynthesis adenylyltransferase